VPEKSFHVKMISLRDSLSDVPSSDDGEDGDNENDADTEHGKLSEDDEPGWVMDTISKTVQYHMERFRPKQMKLDEWTEPGWGYTADYFHERDKMYGAAELRVPAVFKPQTDHNVAAPVLTTLADLLEFLDIFHGRWQMPQASSPPGCSHIRLGSVELHLDTCIPGLVPAKVVD
jgi:hypothetical protein